MKRLLIMVFSLIILLIPQTGHADAKADYETAYKIYIAAGASVAAYSDRLGQLATRYLEQEGWEIDRYVQMQGHDGARFLLAKKGLDGGQTLYVLAFVGTETTGDVHFDLKVDKVYFAGSNIPEFIANAARKEVPVTEPKVHRGFFEFVQSAMAAKTLDDGGRPLPLTDILLANKNSRIYLVGHSLGGAAATLAGAELISMGVRPEQIEVITFGAPAVGNAAFAAQFAPALNLTRIVISGDPVTGVLQSLVGGYKQFGREIRWHMPGNTDQQPHKITEYIDLVLKNYYDKRQQARESGLVLPRPVATGSEGGRQVYVASLKNNLPAALANNLWYMREALGDEYRQKLPGCILAGPGGNANWREQALAAGRRWVVVPELSITQLKQEQNIYYVILTQTVYEAATGAVVETATYSTGTYNLTPLEAFIHDLRGINNHQGAWAETEIQNPTFWSVH